MTDGEENPNCVNPDTNTHWDLTDLFQPVEDAEVRVITMAFGWVWLALYISRLKLSYIIACSRGLVVVLRLRSILIN